MFVWTASAQFPFCCCFELCPFAFHTSTTAWCQCFFTYFCQNITVVNRRWTKAAMDNSKEIMRTGNPCHGQIQNIQGTQSPKALHLVQPSNKSSKHHGWLHVQRLKKKITYMKKKTLPFSSCTLRWNKYGNCLATKRVSHLNDSTINGTALKNWAQWSTRVFQYSTLN